MTDVDVPAARSHHPSWSAATTCSRSGRAPARRGRRRATGELLLLAGEAGIGKTRLLGSVGRTRRAASASRSLRAAGVPGRRRDLGRAAARPGRRPAPRPTTARPQHAGCGAGRPAARGRRRGDGDPHRRRRLLVQDLADTLADARRGQPVLVVLEDLHWADELSLEVLGAPGRPAAPAAPCLVVGAYRSDELYPRTADARVAGAGCCPSGSPRRSGCRGSRRRRPRRWSTPSSARPAPADVVDAHPRRAATASRCTSRSSSPPHGGDRHPGAVGELHVPDTLADVVLRPGRALTRPTATSRDAAAVIGRSFDFDLLAAVTGADPAAVDRRLRELPGRLPGAGRRRRRRLRLPARTDPRRAVRRASRCRRRRALHERVRRGRGRAGATRTRSSPTTSSRPAIAGPAYRHALAAARARRGCLGPPRGARPLPPRPAAPARRTSPAPSAPTCSSPSPTRPRPSTTTRGRRRGVPQAHELRTGGRRPCWRRPRWCAPLVAVAHLLGESLPARVRRLQRGRSTSIDGLSRTPSRSAPACSRRWPPRTCWTAGSTSRSSTATQRARWSRRPATTPTELEHRRPRSARCCCSPAGRTRAGRCSRAPSRAAVEAQRGGRGRPRATA